jgi:hypothetical protein
MLAIMTAQWSSVEHLCDAGCKALVPLLDERGRNALVLAQIISAPEHILRLQKAKLKEPDAQ